MKFGLTLAKAPETRPDGRTKPENGDVIRCVERASPAYRCSSTPRADRTERRSLSSLARESRLSPFHFSRAFKQSFGIPPHRYLTSRRIERAKALLAERTLSVTEIGLGVGFSETSSFTAAFRKLTGETPTEYRRSLA